MIEEEDEYHVTLDFQTESPDLTRPYSLIGLDTKHPILRIDREVYVGTWAVSVGTEMIFNDKGIWIDNVRRRLVLERVEVQKKSKPQEKSLRQMLIRAEDLEESNASGIAVPAQETINVNKNTDPIQSENRANSENNTANAGLDVHMQE